MAPRLQIDQHRDFDLDVPSYEGVEGPDFDLGGEHFQCVPQPAGGTLSRLASAIGRDDRGRQVYNLPDMTAFIEDCLIEETTTTAPGEPDPDHPDAEVPDVVVVEPADDIARFQVLMADKKRPIPVAVLASITVWLSNYYSEDRPTRPSRR